MRCSLVRSCPEFWVIGTESRRVVDPEAAGERAKGVLTSPTDTMMLINFAAGRFSAYPLAGEVEPDVANRLVVIGAADQIDRHDLERRLSKCTRSGIR